ncbi:Uncharacterized [Moorella glycerini]|uniref:Uncharacterized protein n=1 Tax=Neomoorella stamsii TaxID=1266720 RepID=A0A9X7J4B6_9FIRM|nr:MULTISPECIES: hypothetical protein [Moorella]PRR75618.1 hypothetical protein MOST_08010 [Moorella stamsii]CEP66474.1 Uncharacterized [Moorella glycerini]
MFSRWPGPAAFLRAWLIATTLIHAAVNFIVIRENKFSVLIWCPIDAGRVEMVPEYKAIDKYMLLFLGQGR